MAYPNIDARHGMFNHVGRDLYIAPDRDESTGRILRQLQPACMDASDRAECLPGTRVAMIQLIMDWALDPISTQNIFWVHGLAGIGKSTLSTTIANRCRDQGHLGAFLFFSRDVAERSNPATVIRTLAYQIGLFNTRAGEAIATAIAKFPSVCLSPLSVQFQKLIVEPLASVTDEQTTLVLVIDGLDECGTAKKRELLLEVLVEKLIQLPPSIRILITSRSEHDICSAFGQRPQFLEQKFDIASGVNTDDISSYLHHRMERVRSKTKGLSLGNQRPNEDDIRRLTERASGLFVWASTASDFIDGYDPRKRMDIVLKGGVASEAEDTLDILYRTALESAGNWDDEDFVADFISLVGLVLVAQHPLSSTAIDRLLCTGRPCAYTISHLGCVLQQTPTVRPLHPSFADFLTTRSRCGRNIWFFDRIPCKLNLAILCLRRLSQVLCRNICSMTLSVDLEDETLAEDVKYACMFWIEHICAIKDEITSVILDLDFFLNRHLLHWLEAMSILRKSRDAIGLLDKLFIWMTSECPNSGILIELVYDACRLSRTFAASIEEHPLLVYFSALPFAPVTSAIYQMFHDVDTFPTIAGGYQQSWTPQLLVMAGHEGFVRSVASSPDGNRVVSGSDDHTVRVWDARTGAQIFPPLRGHQGLVYAVAFSPDGILIISGSGDGIIRVWDARTGAEVLPLLRGHEREVWTVAFSPNGSRIASGSGDKTVRIWDIISGAEVLPALRGHENSVRSVVFCPDGTRIVSGSDDHTIRIWDANTGGEVLAPLRGHNDVVRAIALSPDGTRIVSGSNDQTIRIWDANSGVQLLPPLRGHSEAVQSVAFSPDGLRIASGSSDHTIRIWNANSDAEALLVLRRHDASVKSVSFSPNGAWITSGSSDKTVRVWHTTASDANLPSAPGHKDVVRAIAFSPDGTRVVSGSNDKTIRVWDARSGVEVVPAMKGHEGMILSVAFSPDGSQIVSGSEDTTVRVWDASSGDEVLAPLRGHDDLVRSVAFSPDGRKIVSGSRDRSIRVWNVGSGTEAIPPVNEHFVRSVAFSSDGTRIISGSRRNGKTRSVWDAKGSRLSRSSTSDNFSRRNIDVVQDRWIVDFSDNRTISFLPYMIDVDICLATNGKSIAIGTPGGRVFVLHFPPSLFTSSESRVIKGRGRPIARRS